MTVDAETLKAEELRLRYVALLKDSSVYPTQANWDYIISHKMEGLGNDLLSKYLYSIDLEEYDREDLHTIAIENFPKYLLAVNRGYALQVIYNNFDRSPKEILRLIRNCNLFDAKKLAALLLSNHINEACSVLDVYQPEYNEQDLLNMKSLLVELDNLPEQGVIENRQGVFGSSIKYVCPNGHSNNGDTTYCTHSGCGLDIFGRTKASVAAIDIYRRRVEALSNLI